jgi:hypothetical protein
MFSLYLVWNVWPVCLMYFKGQSISFGICHFFNTYLFVGGVLLCFVLCFLFGMQSLFVPLYKVLWFCLFSSYLLTHGAEPF